ncbi:MAG: ChaN family lipoprotein [Verrucomicrobiota bacterium]
MKIGFLWIAVLLSLQPLTGEESERSAFWIDLLSAEPVEDLEDMWKDLRESDVVFIGETHRLRRHHRMQVEILLQLVKGDRPIALGLEQIEDRNQPDIDQYNRGELDFEELAEAINWKRQWGNYLDYRELVEAAKENGVPVFGLNAPREVVRQVSQIGIKELDPSVRALLAEEIQTEDPIYERLMNHALSVHSTFDPSFLRNVFEAQVSRDDQMAESIVRAMATLEGEGKPLGVVVAGSGHIQFGLGTPDRVRSRVPNLRDRIVLMTESGDLVLTPMEEAMRRAVEITHEDIHFIRRPAGDYLYAKERKPKTAGEEPQ